MNLKAAYALFKEACSAWAEDNAAKSRFSRAHTFSFMYAFNCRKQPHCPRARSLFSQSAGWRRPLIFGVCDFPEGLVGVLN